MSEEEPKKGKEQADPKEGEAAFRVAERNIEKYEKEAGEKERKMEEDFKNEKPEKPENYLIDDEYILDEKGEAYINLSNGDFEKLIASNEISEDDIEAVKLAHERYFQLRKKLEKKYEERHAIAESEKKLKEMEKDYELKTETPKDTNILDQDEMKQALDMGKEDLSESQEKTKQRFFFEVDENISNKEVKAAFLKQCSDQNIYGIKLYSGNRKEGWIKIAGFFSREKKAEIKIPDYKGSKGGATRTLRISISELNQRLEKFNVMEEELIEREKKAAEPAELKEPKKKEPSTPEKIQAKLDELKKILDLKENDLKTYKEEHPKDADQSVIDNFEKEIAKINEEIGESGKYFDVSREAANITFQRLRDQNRDLEGNLIHGYEDLNAETKKEADKKFNEKTRELWKDLVVHGSVKWNEEKKEFVFRESGDLDVKCCLGLLKEAGINTDYVEYVEQGKSVRGKINIDTGNREGVVVENDGTAFFDHHDPNSPRDTSSAARIYETLVKLGMIEENEGMDKMFNFVNEFENGVYENLDSYYDNSWETLRGLSGFVNFPNLVKFFTKNNNPDPYRKLSTQELKDYGLYFKKKTDDGKEKLITEIVKENVKKDYERLDQLRKDGFIVNSEKYGKIVVDIGGNVKGSFFASRAFGFHTYVNWNPEIRSFFISSEKGIEDNFPQGIKVRGTMLIKPRGDGVQMKMTLEEVLQVMTGGKENLYKILEEKDDKDPAKLKREKLIEFFEKEFQESKKWKSEIKSEEEKKKAEEEKWKIETHIKNAEKDFQEAKEDYWVSRESSRTRAYGISPYEDLFPLDDYSLRKKVKRKNYEEAETELKRLREIAKDLEKRRQFEENEKKRMEGRIRASEVETRFNNAKEELEKARAEYVDMIKNKKNMWDGVNKFFGETREAISKRIKEISMTKKNTSDTINLDQEGVKFNEDTGEKEYYNNRSKFPVDRDVEFYKKLYQEKLEEYKKAVAEEARNQGLTGDELRKKLAKDRELINTEEAAKFYMDSLDARVENYADKSDSWKLVWTKKETWVSKLPDKLAKMSEKISDAYFGTEDMSEEAFREKEEKRREEEVEKQKKEEEEKIKKENKEISDLVKGKIKSEKNAIEKKEKESETLKKLSSFNQPREILRDIRSRISLNDGSRWGKMSKEMVVDEMNKDKAVEKEMKKIIKDGKKVFGEEATPKVTETMEAYTRRLTIMVYRKKIGLNK